MDDEAGRGNPAGFFVSGGNFASLPDGPKIMLAFAMRLGRPERLRVLVMFSKDCRER
ncbi:MAG: hypothetical protein RH982_07855 [Parvibaculum sp.]